MKSKTGWTTMGSVGLTLNSAKNVDDKSFCWAVAGCGAKIPSDKYPVPPPPVVDTDFPVWAIIVFIVGGLALGFMGIKYWRSKVGKARTLEKKRKETERLRKQGEQDRAAAAADKLQKEREHATVVKKMTKEMEEVKKMKGMWTITKALPSRSLARTASQTTALEVGISEELTLILPKKRTPPVLPKKAHYDVTWYWEEDSGQMGNHQPQMTLAHEGLNFVEYAHGVNNEIEDNYQLFLRGQGSTHDLDLENRISTTGTEAKAHHAHTGCLFELNFQTMKQVNKNSGFGRNLKRTQVERAFQPLPVDLDIIIEMDEAEQLTGDVPPLPAGIDFKGDAAREIEPEHILAARPGQIIQVSREHDDKVWLYGSIIIDAAGASKSNTETTGWFPKTIAKPAGAEEMKKIAEMMGGGAGDVLKPPPTWTNPENSQLQVIEVTDREFQAVKDSFMSTLLTHSRYKSIKVQKIERIQNLTMWQSYAVKRQQILMRDKGPDGKNWRQNNKGELERKWMFHGTSMDTGELVAAAAAARS